MSAIIPISWQGNVTCTAWRLSPTILITADHCAVNGEGQEIEVVTTPAGIYAVIARDHVHDLTAIWTNPSTDPSLRISKTSVRLGQPLASVGYGGGSTTPFFTFNVVSNPRMTIHVGPFAINGMIMYGGFVNGMSGGPILNQAGEVVGVVKATGPPHGMYQDIGVGIPLSILNDFIRTLQ